MSVLRPPRMSSIIARLLYIWRVLRHAVATHRRAVARSAGTLFVVVRTERPFLSLRRMQSLARFGNERADVFSLDDALDVAAIGQSKDTNRQLVVAAQGDRSGIHHAHPLLNE